MTIDEIKTALASGDAEMRGRALQALLELARNDESVRAEALPIFRAALEDVQDAWSAQSAARGVELIAGRDEGRRAWLALLEHPHVEVAASCASVIDVSMAPMLLDVLERRAGVAGQVSFVRALGRMKYAPAFDAIVRRLADPELRPHAIEALGELGDARAVEPLTPLLADTTEAWEADNHGPMLRVRDLAKAAIDRFKAVPARAVKVSAPKPGAGPSRLKPKAAPANLLLYAPLVAGLAALPWFGIVAFTLLATTGAVEANQADTRVLDLIAMAPAAVGLGAGGAALLHGRPRNATEILCFVAGMILCGLFVFSFGWGLLHPNVRS